jgi:hypothetical protein
MIHETLVSTALALAMAFAGFAFGLVYFAVMRRTAALFVAGAGWLGPSALTLSRIGAATIFFTFAVKLGATSLLAAFAGFLVARATALRAVRQDM